MKRLRYFPLLLFLFFLPGCNMSEMEAQSDPVADDSLLAVIKMRIEEKKELERMREELLRSPVGYSIKKYKPIIKKYAKRYGFDWRLIAAQIVQESGFREKARSRVGARGLMQIMPFTAREISRELDIEYIMRNPRENITAGIYHLNKQMGYFRDARLEDRTQLALASYNAGAGRVFDAQEISAYFRQPTNQWPTVRPYLSLLKRSDWELHLQVWPDGKPRHGYFYGYNETINYVNHIWERYQLYKKIL